ncbi:MAG TPA: prolyl oligopeptidase family serine peptidase [Bacteroidia bacterium]|nr:prolyl oligopeptidase family serine peptidase [Bacteroidia bacterium]
MIRSIAISLSTIIFISCNSENKNNTQKMMYPQTRKTDSVDTYFGTKVPDPYRWLEDDKSAETAEWVKAQNGITFDYLNKIPYRNNVKERLTQIWNFERYTPLSKKGKYYFFYKNNGVQNQSVLYYQEGLHGEAKVLLDPNLLAEDGTISLGGAKVSKDGKYLAYTINKAGSDWSEIHLMDIASGKKLPDEIKWVKFSEIAWKGNGFYYSAYEAPAGKSELSSKNEFHKIFFHEIGKSQKDDVLIFEDKVNGLRNFAANVTDDEQYLIIYGSESTSGTSLIIKDLMAPNAKFVTIVSNFENNYGVVHNEKNIFYLHTDKNAPKYQLFQVDLNKPQEKYWKTLIHEGNDLLESVSFAYGKFVALYLKDVSSKMMVFDLSGKLDHEIKLPGLCKVEGLSTDKEDSLVFFSYNTFTAPASIYQYSLKSKFINETFKPTIDFKTNEYETNQVFYTSKDGTKIPMFITHKKGIKLDGNNPCFLFGYGGFNSYYAPEFRIDRAIFLEQGGVYAVPGIRGGGEYGEDWHKAGIKCKKQNVFDDFIAAAEFLIKEKYTSSSKLAINGRSNGGLLIGAVMTQRPDLCKVAIPTVGVLDMLRYHKFTIGWAWASDYGTSENKNEFDCLLKYSPLHNVKPAEYPATLVTTGDHDDRVVPAHSFKFIATLQENQKGANPTLVRIDVNAGHGAGKPTAKQIEEAADIWSFVFYNLGVDYK